MTSVDRRFFLLSVTAFATCATAKGSSDEITQRLSALRASLGKGARLGVMAFNTASGRQISFDADSRYAMCSTFKLPLTAFVLSLAERRALLLSEELAFTKRELLDNSPIVQANLARGRLSIEALAAAALRQSDNSAANLLLKRTGGPEALTRFIRACGDGITRCDRYELALNSNAEGDPRDTTTPAAMAALTRTLVVGSVLSSSSRAKLTDWLVTSVAKPDRLKAGFPSGWQVGHKPGTGRGGAVNDVALAWPTGRPPIIAAVYISGGSLDEQARAATHRAIAGIIAKHLP